MHPLGALLLPGERRGEWVAVRRLRAGLALHEPNGLTIGDVDGREQRKTGHANDGSRRTVMSRILPA